MSAHGVEARTFSRTVEHSSSRTRHTPGFASEPRRTEMIDSSLPPSSSRLAGHVLVEALIAQGIDTVFGVPNDMVYQLCYVVR